MNIKQVIEQLNPWWEGETPMLGVPRKEYLSVLESSLGNKLIKFILGPRRTGKTVILFQLIQQLIESGVAPEKIVFLSLDNINLQDLDLYAYLTKEEFEYIFLDEVHLFPNWVDILKSLYDLPTFNAQILCSGSSIKAVTDQQAKLTGRNTILHVNPLRFNEFNEFAAKERQTIDGYLELGGYPEYIIERYPDYLPSLLTDILRKDIVARYRLRREDVLIDLLRLLAKRVGFNTSYTKLANVLGVEDDTIKTYIGYLEDVGLIGSIEKYSPSLNDRIYSPKKFYFLDNGMRNSLIGFTDIGSLAEQSVYNHLRVIKNRDLYYQYTGENGEVDFLLVDPKTDKASQIEVKYTNNEEKIKESLSKEFYTTRRGIEVSEKVVVSNGLLKNIEINGKPIKFVGLDTYLSRDATPSQDL